jgi:predicted acetyltransferase
MTALNTGLSVRTLADGELRGAYDLFRASVHDGPAADEHWDVLVRTYVADRTFGAFDGERLVGTALSFASSLTVPGGDILPMSGVTFVGVRADYRRRGALTGMMRAQLADVAARGEVFAGLRASEPAIYGRFGYGVASFARNIKINTRRAALRADVPTSGRVRLLDKDEIVAELRAAYPRLQPARHGSIGRSVQWWAFGYERRLVADALLVAAHFDADGAIDGWVSYVPQEDDSDDPRAGVILRVLDFQSADQGVANDLWRYLISVDLVDEVMVYVRPTDDPIEVMLANWHAVRSDLDDELWLRIVDVPAALAGRTYNDAPPVVVEVVDPLLPNNSGRYRVGPDGVARTTDAPALTVGPEELSMLYLGTWRASTLAGIGRLGVADPTALADVDRLFATDRAAWGGTLF